jgi:succinate dehydrogenase hydrophobic anchor subunit
MPVNQTSFKQPRLKPLTSNLFSNVFRQRPYVTELLLVAFIFLQPSLESITLFVSFIACYHMKAGLLEVIMDYIHHRYTRGCLELCLGIIILMTIKYIAQATFW